MSSVGGQPDSLSVLWGIFRPPVLADVSFVFFVLFVVEALSLIHQPQSHPRGARNWE